ncbi:MAG: PorV/PorQ family protein [Candidatus Cloacimonetes bacterium]|nr:PorV/PorQ family protein [Candidatus Cloacimonadota bacterium]
MKKKIIIILLMTLICVSLSAEIFGKAGTASMQFLKLGIDARAIGMGEAYTAVTDDVSSVFWNPAGIAWKYETQVFISHTNWVAETYHDFVAVSTETNYGYFGAFASVFHTPPMDETSVDKFGPTGRTFHFTNMAYGLTYANRFTDRFSFGVTGKFLYEQIAEHSMHGFAFDVGSLYNTGFRNITVGMALRNFGPDVGYDLDENFHPDDPLEDRDNSGSDFPIPMAFSLGIVGDVFRNETDYLIFSAQLDNVVDRKETWNVGAEYKLYNLFLRCGYQIGFDAASYSLGFGVRVPTRMAIFNVDYAYTEMGRLGGLSNGDILSGAHRLSLKMSF